jgi:hypothetical protein
MVASRKAAAAAETTDMTPPRPTELPPRAVPRTLDQLPPMPPRRTDLPPASRVQPARPDARPSRLAFGVAGLAAASAVIAAIASPVPSGTTASNPVDTAAGTGAGDLGSTVAVDSASVAAPGSTLQVIHVKRVIQLKPGETPPAGAAVTAAPAPTPRVVVIQAPPQPAQRIVVTTRQSGKP